MNILAIDTAADDCAACVFDTDKMAEKGRCVRHLGKGHAEHVMAVIGEALAAAGTGYDGLGAIAVSVGPGSFTGVRVGVAAARGLALALKIPAIGVNTLEALAAEARAAHPGKPVIAVIGTRPENFFTAGFDASGEMLFAPVAMPLETVAEKARELKPVLCGNAAEQIGAAAGVSLACASLAATADIAVFANIAATREAGDEKPKPLYLRAPDAVPQKNFALPHRPA